MNKIKVAVIGYGNLGKYAIKAIESSYDMELAGVVRRDAKDIPCELKNKKVVDKIDKLGLVDVALLCVPSRNVEQFSKEILEKGINTVDSFDIHSDIFDLKMKLNGIAKKNESKAIIACGWDPGIDSTIRALLKATIPSGITFTNFGPGMSLGHSVVAKSKKGVLDAMVMTMPVGDGIHRRVVYLETEEGSKFDEICKEIKNDSYFINDETRFIKVDNIKDVIDMGHGVCITRKGSSSATDNQLVKFDMRINSPALTAQTMVAYARACMRVEPGAYTTIEIPVLKLLPGSEEDIIKGLV